MNPSQQIIKKCINGDEPSCKLLYESCLAYCYGICIRYGVQQSEIKDQIQIIFSSTFKSLANYDNKKASFKTWFTRICINKIIEQRRVDARKINLETLTNEAYQSSSYMEVGSEIDKEYMLKILSKMPYKYQCVFNMFVIDGYSHKEICEKLNISTSASRVLLKRGRDWAKETLNLYLQTS